MIQANKTIPQGVSSNGIPSGVPFSLPYSCALASPRTRYCAFRLILTRPESTRTHQTTSYTLLTFFVVALPLRVSGDPPQPFPTYPQPLPHSTHLPKTIPNPHAYCLNNSSHYPFVHTYTPFLERMKEAPFAHGVQLLVTLSKGCAEVLACIPV